MNAQRGVLLLLIAALSYLSFQLVQPYLQFVIGALLLTYVLSPLQNRLETRVGSTAAAALLVVFATVALLIPFVVLLVAIAGDATQFARRLASGEIAVPIEPVEESITEWFGREIDLTAEVAARIEGVAELALGTAPDILATLTTMLIGLGLAVFVLFYLLRDGDRLFGWLRRVTPLPDEVQERLYNRVDDITRAVLLGHVLVAIIQGRLPASACSWSGFRTCCCGLVS